MSDPNERMRQHPEERFHAPQLHIDLEKVAATLLAEPLPANRHHRQETLYRRHPITVALFLFEAGAELRAHSADGVVTVQVLQGRLKMTVEEQTHDLPAGSLLVLAPGVKHDVHAAEPTRMLLTVCLEGN